MPRPLVFTYEYQAHSGDVLGLARAVDLGLLGDVEHNKWSDTKTGGAPVIELDARVGQESGSYPLAVWMNLARSKRKSNTLVLPLEPSTLASTKSEWKDIAM